MISKKHLIAALMVVSSAILPVAANATQVTYDWTFQSTTNDNTGKAFDASGTLTIDTTTAQGTGSNLNYSVSSITGSDSYGAITGLVPTGTNGSYLYDNRLYTSGVNANGTSAYLDWNGILYTDTARTVNLFSDMAGISGDRYAADAVAYDNNHNGVFAISAVPLPAALPMFGAALAGLGGLGLKHRKNIQAA